MEYIEITCDNAEDFSAFIDEDMQENLDRVFFRGLGAVDDAGQTVGALVYELKDSESEDDTRSRIRVLSGSDEVKEELMTRYTEDVSDEDVIESFYESSDEVMSKTLESDGFSFAQSEALDLPVTMESIQKIANMLKVNKMPDFIKPLSEVSILQYRSFIKNCLFKGNRGLVDDLAYLPKNWFEMDVSSCALDKDEVNAVLLLKRAPSGVLYVLLYTAFGPDAKKNLSFLIANTAQKLLENYPPETKIIIRRHNEMVTKLTAKLFAGVKGETVFSGSRNEAS
jgi:hypothetical protein